MALRSLLRSVAPTPVIAGYRRLKDLVAEQRSRDMSTEDVFTEIYDKKRWGSHQTEAFCSGSGSTTDACVSPYIAAVGRIIARDGATPPVFVDLGCGDFRVGQRLLPLCARYIGVDIVRPLVEHNQATYGSATVTFMHRNLVTDALPAGDVCFVRQVLQHLSNDQIAAVLGKLGQFSRVFITEHYPCDSPRIVPNLDKTHGGDTRVHRDSGVYLTQPPFNLPADAVAEVLHLPAPRVDDGSDPGVLRTFLYTPSPSRRTDV